MLMSGLHWIGLQKIEARKSGIIFLKTIVVLYRADSGFVQMDFETPDFIGLPRNDLHKTSIREV